MTGLFPHQQAWLEKMGGREALNIWLDEYVWVRPFVPDSLQARRQRTDLENLAHDQKKAKAQALERYQAAAKKRRYQNDALF